MKKEKVKINIESLEYEVMDSGREGILPSGQFELEDALFQGRLYSSRGGFFKWSLPEEAILGYGDFNPYAEFLFTGRVSIFWPSRAIDSFKRYGWITQSPIWRHIDLDGVIRPTYKKRLERVACRLADRSKPGPEEVWGQGHLRISPLFTPPGATRFERVAFSSPWNRRRIFNHEFFGDYVIFFDDSSRRDWVWRWILINNRGVKISSPDHIMEPLSVGPGWYICTHPRPNGDNVD